MGTKDEPWRGNEKGGCGNNELEVRRALLSSHAGIVAYLYLPVVTPCAQLSSVTPLTAVT